MIGSEIRSVRETKSKSQQYAAHMMNLSLTAYRNKETGRSPLSFDEVVEFSRVMQMTKEEKRLLLDKFF